MKTSKSKLISVPFIIAFILICGTGFSQKSINYQSVGTNLEEIANFFDNTCPSLDKVTTEVVNEKKSLVKKEKANEIIDKVTDCSEVNLKDLHEAVKETKIWLSKQNFAPIKKSKHVNKDLAEQSAD